MDANMAQLERSNNKCYTSIFRYIYIYIVKYIELFEFNYSHAPQCFSKLENLTKLYIYIYISLDVSVLHLKNCPYKLSRI